MVKRIELDGLKVFEKKKVDTARADEKGVRYSYRLQKEDKSIIINVSSDNPLFLIEGQDINVSLFQRQTKLKMD